MSEAKDLTAIEQKVNEIVAGIQSLSIQTDEEYQSAGEFLKKCKVSAKEVENYYSDDLEAAKEKKRIAEEERKKVQANIKAYTDKLDKAERAAKRIMAEYSESKEKERREAERKRIAAEEEKRIAEAIETGDDEVLDKPPEKHKESEGPKVEGTYTVTIWEYEIVDKSKINPEYVMPDNKAIGSLVRSQHEKAQDILGPGVRVYSRKDVRARV